MRQERRARGRTANVEPDDSQGDREWQGRRREGILRNSTFALLSQLATACFTAVLTLYLVRALGPKQYGVFALAISIGGIVLLPSDFGISTSTVRFVAEHQDDRETVSSVVSDALKLKLIISTSVCVVLFALAGAFAGVYGEPTLTWPLRGVAIAIFGQTLLAMFGGTFVALQRTSVYLMLVFSESAVETGASIALVLLGAGATGAAFGRAAGYIVGSVLAVFAIARTLGPRALDLRWSLRRRTRQIARYGTTLLLIDTSFTIYNEIDILLIGALLTGSSVGFFSAPMRLLTFLSYPTYAIAAGVAPRVAAPDGQRVSQETYQTALRVGVILQGGLLAPVIVWATPIVHLLLGPKFAPSADVLRLLAPLVLFTGIGALTSTSVNYLGEARRRVPIAIGTALLNAAIDAALLPRIGVIGGAIGTDIAYMLYVLGHLWICTTSLNLDLSVLSLTLARVLSASVAMGAVMAAFGTTTLSAVELIAGATAGAATYLAILAVTRELTLQHVALARQAASRLARR